MAYNESNLIKKCSFKNNSAWFGNMGKWDTAEFFLKIAERKLREK